LGLAQEYTRSACNFNDLENHDSSKQFSQISAQDAAGHWSKMKRIILGRIGSNLNLVQVVSRLKTYYLEVEQGKRVQVPKSDQ